MGNYPQLSCTLLHEPRSQTAVAIRRRRFIPVRLCTDFGVIRILSLSLPLFPFLLAICTVVSLPSLPVPWQSFSVRLLTSQGIISHTSYLVLYDSNSSLSIYLEPNSTTSLAGYHRAISLHSPLLTTISSVHPTLGIHTLTKSPTS